MTERKATERGKRSGEAARMAQVRQRVFDLRAGPRLPFHVIGKEVGLSAPSAHRLYNEALDAAREHLGEMAQRHVAEMCETYDRLITSHWQKRDQPAHARIILRCIADKRRLLGVDQPQRVEHSGQVEVTRESAEERRLRIFSETADRFAKMTPDELAAEAAGLEQP